MARRSVTKKVLIGVVAAVTILVILIAMTPMLISAGLGHGTIRTAIEERLAPGSGADFQGISVTWRGPQEVRGLRIVDHSGEEVADVNMRISPGLLALVFGTAAAQEVAISGTVRAQLYDDGTTNIQRDVLPEPAPRPATERRPPMQGIPRTLVRMDGLDVHLTHVAPETGERQAMLLRDLRGEASYDPAGPASPSEVAVNLEGQTVAADAIGGVRLVGRSVNLFDRAGWFTPHGAPLNLELTGNTIPVLGMDIPAELTQFAMTIRAENMAEHVTIDADAEAVIQDEAPSRFRAEIGISVPFTREGRLDMTVESVAGTMRGERVPASLIQPLLADTPVVLRRDVGSAVDLDVQLTPAEDGLATVRVTGARAQLDLAARHDAESNWWLGERLVLRTPQAHPDLVRGLTQLNVDRPVNLEINMTSFAFPPVDPATGTRLLRQYGGTGVLRVNEPVAIVFDAGEPLPQAGVERSDAPGPQPQPRSVLIEHGEIEFNAPALGEHVDLAGQMRIEGASVRLQERITNLFDEQGEMDVVAANVVGELAIENLPARMIAQWMPEQEEMIAELLGEQVNATLVTTMEETGLQATLVARGDAVETNLIALRTADALEITQTWAEFTLTPRLMEYLQREDEEPIVLVAPTTARLELDPLVLQGREPREYRLRESDVRGRLLLEALAVDQVPGFAEPVSLRQFNATFHAVLARDPLGDEPVDRDEPLLAQYSIEGGAVLARHATGDSVASVAYSFTGRPRVEETELSGSLALRDVQVRSAELLMGREPGLFELWAGDAGTLTVNFTGVGQRYEATLVSEMPRLQGTFNAAYADELVTLAADGASILLGAEALENLMRGEGPDATPIRVERDVPLTLSLSSRMPLGFLTQEPFDPTLLDITAEMRGGPLAMTVDRERTTLDNVHMALTTDGFSDSVNFNLVIEGDVRDERTEAPVGGVDIRGSLREPVRAGEPMGFADARFDLDAALDHAPTAFADALLGMRGYLTATVGAHVDGTITARQLSRTAEDGGTLAVDLRSPHGWLRGGGAGRSGALAIGQDEPVEGELEFTPLLRDVVLSRLSPLLGAVLLAEQPLSATFAPASLPLDGDITKLSGDLRLTIGDVQMDHHSPMFAILRMARVRETALSGHIEPIVITITDGVINYDRFNLRLNGFEMPYSGQINLETRQVRLRTALPLAALGIRELDRLAEVAGDLQVPLVTRGTLGEPLRLELDPEFDIAGELLRRGLEGQLRDLLPGAGNDRRDPRDLLRDLLRPPRRD